MKKFFLPLAALTIAALFIACGGDAPSGQSAQGASGSGNSVDEIARGKKLYDEHGCAGCHGQTGQGDGPVGMALTPKPRNFQDIELFVQGSSIEAIADSIARGVPGTAMVSYPHIPDSDRRLIARYIANLQSN